MLVLLQRDRCGNEPQVIHEENDHKPIGKDLPEEARERGPIRQQQRRKTRRCEDVDKQERQYACQAQNGYVPTKSAEW